MNITLRQLRAFVAVAEARSFTEAAVRLHLTQSAVSMLVRQLEADFGLPLFVRTTRAVSLTEAGLGLLPAAQRMLADLQEVFDGARDLRELRRGSLRIAAPQMFACSLLPRSVERFHAEYPDISLGIIDVTADEVGEAVRRHDAEIGVGPERPVPDDVTRTLLWAEPIDLVCHAGSRWAGARRLAWADVLAEPWVLYSDEFAAHLERLLHPGQPGFRLHRATEARYMTTALALVGRGVGVTAAPRYVAPFAAGFGVRFVELEAPAVRRNFCLYRRRGFALSPAAEAFLARLEADRAEEVAGGTGPAGTAAAAGGAGPTGGAGAAGATGGAGAADGAEADCRAGATCGAGAADGAEAAGRAEATGGAGPTGR
ncbi:LysR family transcriptional regulator [Paroceanicella profunda]|uniref:LysR family transcriptional regulator n=1 Tax=Paroceanicella profunda TaxID=2579971 RepID=A0A5B8FXD7_9RHOB|nr:LysR family transcriptional regulator [Paroceanicella profunda]QDL91179.1 LysR family transcriptional regulator [Paroceanicella profunda]